MYRHSHGWVLQNQVKGPQHKLTHSKHTSQIPCSSNQILSAQVKMQSKLPTFTLALLRSYFLYQNYFTLC